MPAYRSSYHYGNLRAALTEAALDLARRGGPAAVTVRGVARSVGVTPPAAYRHFTEVEELLTVTKGRALQLLAERVDAAIGSVTAAEEPGEGTAVAAAACLRAVAEAYVGFAKCHPGLFAMACHASTDTIRLLAADRIGPLLDALSARHPGKVFALWSAVHALAVLAAECGGEGGGEGGGSTRDLSQDEVLEPMLAWIASFSG